MAAPPDKNNHGKNPWLQIGRYSHLAMALPASIVAGLIIGSALDHWLKTKWFTIVGLVLGCVAGFTELIRGIIRASKES
jgi:F0F1-type ATP synthase assembly protein I